MTSKVSVIVTAAALGSLVYLIAWPMLTSPFAPVVDRPAGFVVEEPTYGELFRARLGKLMVFGFFSYFGACFGSFLNVVAASAPKGESIVTRSSSCPRCGTPIRTRDNWPL
ncbi:MAG: prepilin peptidase, partial [Planctomycetota bacterium]